MTLYTIQEAARKLAEERFDAKKFPAEMHRLRLPESKFDQLKNDTIESNLRQYEQHILDAAKNGALKVRHPQAELPYKPAIYRPYYDLVSDKDLDAWLSAELRVGSSGNPQPTRETGEHRDERRYLRCNELRSLGVRDWQLQVAKEEGVSVSAIKQARYRHTKRRDQSPAPASPALGDQLLARIKPR